MAESRTSRATDDDKAVEGTGSGPSQESTGNKIAGSGNLEEVLKMLQAQLNFPQQQLDFLRGLAPSIEPIAPQPVLTLRDCEHAVRWMEKRGPESVDMKDIGTAFIKHCCDGNALWFSRAEALTKYTYFISRYGVPGTRDNLQQELLSQRLQQAWPTALGVVKGPIFYWKNYFGVTRWDFYDVKGDEMTNITELVISFLDLI
jgi:hypothetical protein